MKTENTRSEIQLVGFFPLNQQNHTGLSFCEKILQISNLTHFDYIILNETGIIDRNHSLKKSSLFATVVKVISCQINSSKFR